MRHRLVVRRARAQGETVGAIAARLRDDLAVDDPSGVLFFATADVDFTALAAELHEAFGGCTTMGCTTAGEILSESGHVDSSVVAVALGSPALKMHATLIPGEACDSPQACADAARTLLGRRQLGLPDSNTFALVLIDGLGMLE